MHGPSLAYVYTELCITISEMITYPLIRTLQAIQKTKKKQTKNGDAPSYNDEMLPYYIYTYMYS